MGGRTASGDFRFGSWRVDVSGVRLVSRGGGEVMLTLRELEILRHLHGHPWDVFSHDYLMTRFWGIDFNGSDASLTMAMARLRHKLGRDGRLIRTAYGRGYRYVQEKAGRPRARTS